MFNARISKHDQFPTKYLYIYIYTGAPNNWTNSLYLRLAMFFCRYNLFVDITFVDKACRPNSQVGYIH